VSSDEIIEADKVGTSAAPEYTTLSVQVRGRPPATGSDDQNDGEDGDDDGGSNGIATGTNPFTIIVTTNETSSATVDFAYGQGSTTFLPVDLPTYFTGAVTSAPVTGAAPNLSIPITVLTVGTVYWVQASGCGLTSPQVQFKRTV